MSELCETCPKSWDATGASQRYTKAQGLVLLESW
jgi:hypothetical protein